MVVELPVYQIKGKRYFRDARLREYRNVDNPGDIITFERFDRENMRLEAPTLPHPSAVPPKRYSDYPPSEKGKITLGQLVGPLAPAAQQELEKAGKAVEKLREFAKTHGPTIRKDVLQEIFNKMNDNEKYGLKFGLFPHWIMPYKLTNLESAELMKMAPGGHF